MSSPKYSRLRSPVSSEDEEYTDEQFREPEAEFATRAIVIAILLFLIATAILTLGILLLTGVIDSKFYNSCYPLILLATIVFARGVCHLRIAYCVWRGYDGYSYDDIPSIL